MHNAIATCDCQWHVRCISMTHTLLHCHKVARMMWLSLGVLTYSCMLQGDKVKKGQTVAYIEQLGTFVPVEVCKSMPRHAF